MDHKNIYGLSEKTMTKVLFTTKDLNEAIAGKTVHSVEPGHTPGWLVINLTPSVDCRCFLTVWCGGTRERLDPEHDWDIALHYKSADGGGLVTPVYRSHRPEGNEILDETSAQFRMATGIQPIPPSGGTES